MTQTLIECLNRLKGPDDTRGSVESVEPPKILKAGSPQKYSQIVQELLARHQKSTPSALNLTNVEKRMWQDIKNLHHLNETEKHMPLEHRFTMA